MLEGSETLEQSSESDSDLIHKDLHMMKCHGYFRKLTLEEVFQLDQTTEIQMQDGQATECHRNSQGLTSAPVKIGQKGGCKEAEPSESRDAPGFL